MRNTTIVTAVTVTQRLDTARAELAAAQDSIGRSIDLADLFEGPPQADLNAAVQSLQRCTRAVAIRLRDPQRGADT